MNRLRELRKSKNLTQKQVAKEINVSAQSYGYYENWINKPDPETLVKLADFFDVSIDFLVGRSDDFDNVTVVSKAPNGSTPQEEELLKFFRGINANDKLSVLRVARSFYLEEQEKKESKKLG